MKKKIRYKEISHGEMKTIKKEKTKYCTLLLIEHDVPVIKCPRFENEETIRTIYGGTIEFRFYDKLFNMFKLPFLYEKKPMKIGPYRSTKMTLPKVARPKNKIGTKFLVGIEKDLIRRKYEKETKGKN